ncbi:MAG TPA: DUF5694 domain-containing protein [Rhizomicrobium sp.]|jgi:hypothetical protein
MRTCLLLLAILFGALPALGTAQEVTKVLVLGTFHMSNPHRDLHNVTVDDVLAPKRQTEIAGVVAGLARFRPTEIDVEWPAALVAQRHAAFLKGTLPPSRNEVVQLGFRLARASGAQVRGIDIEGAFPYDAVVSYAKAHGESDLLAGADAQITKEVTEQQKRIDAGSIGHALRWINEPARIRADNDWYAGMLKVGSGAHQPGADLLAAWYQRNMRICAQIVQLSRPGDRVVVIFGAGHAFLLRQCVSQMPGYRIVEPNDYLPQ